MFLLPSVNSGHGEKAFLETITQIPSYRGGRNTKSAVVIFNRNVSLTKVLNSIAAAVPKPRKRTH